MPQANRFSDPPREIPVGVLLKLLASRNLTGSLLAFIPAAALLISAANSSDPSAKAAPLFFVAVLLVAGLMTVLPALAKSMQALSRMRYGFMTLGRIISFRFSWSPPDEEIRYVEFLSNWVAILSIAQLRKLKGSAMSISIAPFVVIFGLGIALMVIVLLKWLVGEVNLDLELILIMVTLIAGFSYGISRLLRPALQDRRQMTNEMKPYLVSHQAPQETNDAPDDLARRLSESAAKRGAYTQVKGSLSGGSTLELICRVEYLVQGERRTSEGRVRHTSRLDPAGVEPLLFHPTRRKKVTFLSGLPEGVHLDARGQWEPVPAAGPALVLALTALVAGTVLVNLPLMMAFVRGPQ